MKSSSNARLSLVLAAGVAVFLAGAPAMAQSGDPVRVRGAVASLEGSTLVVHSREGADVTIHLADDWAVTGVVKASMADIKPGAFIGAASLPQTDSSQRALEVLVFPEGMRGFGEGHYPWDLKPASMMTNATVANAVDSVDGRSITVSYKGGEKKITISGGCADRHVRRSGKVGRCARGDGVRADAAASRWKPEREPRRRRQERRRAANVMRARKNVCGGGMARDLRAMFVTYEASDHSSSTVSLVMQVRTNLERSRPNRSLASAWAPQSSNWVLRTRWRRKRGGIVEDVDGATGGGRSGGGRGGGGGGVTGRGPGVGGGDGERQGGARDDDEQRLTH